MEHLARATGGRVIDVGNSGPKLEAAFTQIQDELRTQYRLTYTPTTPADSNFHPQEITCGPHHTVATRKGYYALPTDRLTGHNQELTTPTPPSPPNTRPSPPQHPPP